VVSPRLWQRVYREYAGQHKEMIHAVRFSPDGLKLVTASRDTTAIVWDVASARVLWKLEGHLKDVYHAAFSINGNLVARRSRWNAQDLEVDARTLPQSSYDGASHINRDVVR